MNERAKSAQAISQATIGLYSGDGDGGSGVGMRQKSHSVLSCNVDVSVDSASAKRTQRWPNDEQT